MKYQFPTNSELESAHLMLKMSRVSVQELQAQLAASTDPEEKKELQSEIAGLHEIILESRALIARTN